MKDTITPPNDIPVTTAIQQTIINEPSVQSEGIKKFPTYDEVLDITRKIAQEESSKVKDSLATNSVTVLGIFASFIAFLTIEVQVLKTICDYSRILGFSLFILVAVLLFACFIIYFTDSQTKKIRQVVLLFVTTFLLVIAGIFFITKGEDEYLCKLNRLDTDFQKLQQNLQDQNDKWLIESSKEFSDLKTSLPKK